MTRNGMGPYQIARTLTDEKILRPTAYIALRDGRSIPNPDKKFIWGDATVQGIISKPEYMGSTVNFRTYKDSYKDKKFKFRPQEEWLVFENTQPCIVDPETWQTAQKCRSVKRRPNSTGKPNPLTGLVYCADCDSRMYNHRKGTGKKYDSQDSYACQGYSRYPHKCTMHYIKTSTLEKLALEAIRAVSWFAREDEDAFVRMVRDTRDIQSTEMVKAQRKRLAKTEKRHKELDSLIRQLYEDKVGGSLTAKRFEILSGEYEAEQEDLERQITALQVELEACAAEIDNTDRFIKMAQRYTEIPELTATILNEYIDKIIVFEADKSSGRREQSVDFHFNFIGKVALPGQDQDADREPFDPVEHRRAQFRAYYHRNREKILADKAERAKALYYDEVAMQSIKTPEELAAEEEVRREKKRAYQREYQRERQRKRREQKNQGAGEKSAVRMSPSPASEHRMGTEVSRARSGAAIRANP